MGHTLNGFYDVQSGSNKIASIYCDFSKTPTTYQTSVGIVDIQSTSVHFFVIRNVDWVATNAPITSYDRQELNVGGGMNANTGIFTAPKTGIYQFTFRAISNAHWSSTGIGFGMTYLVKNGETYETSEKIEVSYTLLYGAGGPAYFTNSLHTTMKLIAGDRITLILYRGSLVGAYGIVFTGSLLEEDLVIS